MRYLIKFSYDGSEFSGYQKQPNERCVESEFEKALFEINNHKATLIYSSGRTDRGVHALGQTAHFDLDINITLYKLKCALNSLLPSDIHVFSTETVDKNFHARYDAKEKLYRYLINTGEYSPCDRKYCYQHCKKLDVDKMKKAIKLFLGTHSFVNFVSNEGVKGDCIRSIYDCNIVETDDKIEIYFLGSGFMKYQVRNMVGTLIQIGSDKLEPFVIKELLDFKLSKDVVKTANREGLYLVSVKY